MQEMDANEASIVTAGNTFCTYHVRAYLKADLRWCNVYRNLLHARFQLTV